MSKTSQKSCETREDGWQNGSPSSIQDEEVMCAPDNAMKTTRSEVPEALKSVKQLEKLFHRSTLESRSWLALWVSSWLQPKVVRK